MRLDILAIRVAWFAGMCVGRRPLAVVLRTPALTLNRTLPFPAIPALRLSLNSPLLTSYWTIVAGIAAHPLKATLEQEGLTSLGCPFDTTSARLATATVAMGCPP